MISFKKRFGNTLDDKEIPLFEYCNAMRFCKNFKIRKINEKRVAKIPQAK